MKKEYMAIQWGNNVRMAHNKTDNVGDACKQCYGAKYPEMYVYHLGANKKIAIKKFNQLLKEFDHLTAR